MNENDNYLLEEPQFKCMCETVYGKPYCENKIEFENRPPLIDAFEFACDLMKDFEIFPNKNIIVEQTKNSIRIGIPENVNLKNLISVVNFQLGYNAMCLVQL